MQNINIIISNISTITITNTGVRTGTYFFEDNDEKKVVGKMTNEAPIVLLEEKLKSRGETLSKMMFIASEKVRNPITDDIQNRERNLLCVECVQNELEALNRTNLNPKKVTHLNLLQYYLEQHLGKTIDDVMEVFEIEDEPHRKDVVSVVYKIKDYIEGLTQNPETKVNIYVEANGGVRYVAFMLINVLQLLEKNDPNHIEIQSVYNTVYSQEDKLTRISDTLNIYQSVELVSATDEFIMYGRTASLKRYFDDILENTNDATAKQDIKNCLASLEKLEDDIQLCRTENIFNDINKTLVDIQGFLTSYENFDEENVVIFRDVCKDIKNEMENNGLNVENNSIINVIEWLNNKGFVQQALTMCAEKLPEVFFKKGYLKFVPPEIEEELEKNHRKKNGLVDFHKWLLTSEGIKPLKKRIKANHYLEKAVVPNYKVKVDPDQRDLIWKSDITVAADDIFDGNGRSLKDYVDNYFYNYESKEVTFEWLCGIGNSPEDFKQFDLNNRKIALEQFGNDPYLIEGFPKLYENRSKALNIVDSNKRKRANKNANTQIKSFIAEASLPLRDVLESQKVIVNGKRDDETLADFLGRSEVFDQFYPSLKSHFVCAPSDDLLNVMSDIIDNTDENLHDKLYSMLTKQDIEYTGIMQKGSEITTDYPDKKQELADIFYLYYFLKQQRNKANHASEDKSAILLNSEQTKDMIMLTTNLIEEQDF